MQPVSELSRGWWGRERGKRKSYLEAAKNMTFSTILERYLVREVDIMPYLEDLEQNLVN